MKSTIITKEIEEQVEYLLQKIDDGDKIASKILDTLINLELKKIWYAKNVKKKPSVRISFKD